MLLRLYALYRYSRDMPRIKYDDNTYFKHTKESKRSWKKAAQIEKYPDLSYWIRSTLDARARLASTYD